MVNARQTEADGPAAAAQAVPAQLRAQAVLQATFARVEDRTALRMAHESGGLRLMVPRPQHGCEAVMVNTGGGIAGGDRWRIRFEALPGACVTLTSQSAERVYRSQGTPASISTELIVSPHAKLMWIPQETILFQAAGLHRQIDVAMAPEATLVLAEAAVFGRTAMGEDVVTGAFRDRWRVRRDDALVFAENVRLEGEIAAILDRAACGGGARALATVLVIAPDAEARLTHIREAIDAAAASSEGLTTGASAWDGMLLVRVAALRPAMVRHVLGALLPLLCGRPLPRVWQ